MIRHETPGKYFYRILFPSKFQNFDKRLKITIFMKDFLSAIAAIDDMAALASQRFDFIKS
jgi:hypothetical protein